MTLSRAPVTPEMIEGLRRLRAMEREGEEREQSDLVDYEDVLNGRHGG